MGYCNNWNVLCNNWNTAFWEKKLFKYCSKLLPILALIYHCIILLLRRLFKTKWLPQLLRINFCSKSGSHFLKLSNNSIFTESFIRWSQPMMSSSFLKGETIVIRTKGIWCDIMSWIYESLQCSVDFLKRQHRFFITYSLTRFLRMFHPISVNSQILENELWDIILPLKSSSHFSQRLCYFVQWERFKKDFLFNLKALLVFKIFAFLFLVFSYAEKAAWLEHKVSFKIYDFAIWLTNNYNTLTAEYITKRSNQTIKFGQLIEYNKRIFFFKNYAENETGTLVPNIFLLFRKVLYEEEASFLQPTFIIIR